MKFTPKGIEPPRLKIKCREFNDYLEISREGKNLCFKMIVDNAGNYVVVDKKEFLNMIEKL